MVSLSSGASSFFLAQEGGATVGGGESLFFVAGTGVR